MGRIKCVCKNCSRSFSFKKGGKAICPSCKKEYSSDTVAESYDVQTSNNTVEWLTEQEIRFRLKDKRLNNRMLASTANSAWIELRRLLPEKKEAKGESKPYIAGYILFILSLLVNVILLIIIHLQQEKIEILIK